jgi:hypothetical protein
MSSEQEELLDESYRNYSDSHWISPSNSKGKLLSEQLYSLIPMEHSKESFINEIKNNPKFSKKWGLKIEERELSREERITIYVNQYMEGIGKPAGFEDAKLSTRNIPKKVTTISYNDKTIESYE